MPHEISEIDRQQGTEMAWHGLTEVKPVITLRECFLSLWDVSKRALFRILTDGTQEKTEACEVVCTDDEKIVIGNPVHIETYTLLPNSQFLSIVQNTLDLIRGATVASVGSVCRRARIFVSLALPADLSTFGETLSLNAAGRQFKFYLSFFSSHDKSAPFGVQLSSVCVVCNNTFGMVLHDTNEKALKIRIPHTKNMNAALADVPAIVDSFFTSAQRFADKMNQLAQIPIAAGDAKAFFAGFLVGADTGDARSAAEQKEVSGRRQNQIDRLTSLFVSGKGNNGANLADVFSAATDYYSHESSGGENPMKQVASSEFGNGAMMKALAWRILLDDKKTAQTIANGQKVLATIAAQDAK